MSNCVGADGARTAGFGRAYGVGVAKNHAFVDGNKRAAFLRGGLFLRLIGQRLKADQAEATLAMWAMTEGKLDELEFSAWTRRCAAPNIV